MTQVIFPRESYRRFHQKMQFTRACLYPICISVPLILKSAKVINFDLWWVLPFGALGVITSVVLYWLYKIDFEDRFKIPLIPFWMAQDILAVTFGIYSTGEPITSWFVLYLVPITAATFTSGLKGAFWAGSGNLIAYTSVVIILSPPEDVQHNLLLALFPLAVMYLAMVFFLRGIAMLRRKQLEVKELMIEKNDTLQSLMAQAYELERAYKDIQTASKLKSKFLANMSHELRTPLNSIIGFSELLIPRSEGKLDKKEIRFLQNIHISGKHLLNLINDILDLSKVEAGKMEIHLETISLAATVEGVIGVMFGVASSRKVRLNTSVPVGLPDVIVDGARLKQILFNLTSNAVKFSEDGTEVLVTVNLLGAAKSPLKVDSFQLRVQDFGHGIKFEDQGRVFSEFKQVDEGLGKLYEGTGLGLPLVKKFCELMGGRIDLESEYGEGSIFTATLPQDATPFVTEGD